MLNICLLISGRKISVEIFGESLDTPKNAACFDLGKAVHPSSPRFSDSPDLITGLANFSGFVVESRN